MSSTPMSSEGGDDVLRIANCSGFYGDRLSAAHEMVHGGPIDVLTGDYLAELTLSILAKDRRHDPNLGYAKTFLIQLKQIAATCLQRGIKIVVNAGGLNPSGCAAACREIYRELGLDARVAHIEGDDLLPRLKELQRDGEAFEHLDRGLPLDSLDAPVLSANAYLGAWGIAKALELGADLVICPRVTDASLVVGPAAWRFSWARDDWDRLAGAVVAGHVIECGAQATGGNYAFFRRLPKAQPLGFPLVEMKRDGSFTVTKHPGRAGEVSIGTVTAQLLYEIETPRYLNPDVIARFDTLQLLDDGPDRVRVEAVKGEPAPASKKVCINHFGGFKNSVTFLLTGLDVKEKAAWLEQALWTSLGGRDAFSEIRVSLHRAADGDGSVESSCSFLTLAVKASDRKLVGRRFSAAAVELALACYPGFNLTAPPTREGVFAVYWPALVSKRAITHRVVLDDEFFDISDPALDSTSSDSTVSGSTAADDTAADDTAADDTGSGLHEDEGHPDDCGQNFGPTESAYLGSICGARSGDKGGNANLGIWAESDAAFRWLHHWLTPERLQTLIPESRDLKVERYVLANLRSLNFMLRGFLGEGVAASLAVDAQAKGLGEYLRGKRVAIPISLLKKTQHKRTQHEKTQHKKTPH